MLENKNKLLTKVLTKHKKENNFGLTFSKKVLIHN